MIARGRIRDKGMNRTEARYAGELDLRQKVGEIAWYDFEGVTLKLGFDCRYTPDFAVMLANGELEMHEVKGSKSSRRSNGTTVQVPYSRDDSKVKIRVAARMFPFRFKMVHPTTAGWEVVDF